MKTVKNTFNPLRALTLLALISAVTYFGLSRVYSQTTETVPADQQKASEAQTNPTQTAIFAGGCFWCIESDFEKLEGVIKAVSGYTGGAASTASYKQVGHSESKHYEAVQVHYDSSKLSYAQLVEYFWRHIDPTDAKGQFCDKGSPYRSAIFYANMDEKIIAEKSLEMLQSNKPFKADIVTPVVAASPFYKAEQYHQNYYKKNPIRYKYYRNSCGRDKRVKQLWADEK